MKICINCKQAKPFSEFWRRAGQPGGVIAWCKPCARARDVARKRNHGAQKRARKKYIEKMLALHGPGWRRASSTTCRRRREYRLEPGEFERMKAEQGGVCFICKKPQRHKAELCVDHDHTTGKVRALLCTGCNQGIGAFREDPDLMASAIRYVIAHSTIQALAPEGA